MIIIGIDPGTATTGYGIIEKNGSKCVCVDYGTIKTVPEWRQEDRLKKIGDDFLELIEKYQPEILAIESLYFFKNAKTAIPVSQARGVVMMTASRKSIPVHEFTPLQAKMAITGYGRADKAQVQKMLKIILDLEEIPRPDDAADALAIALCFAFSQT